MYHRTRFLFRRTRRVHSSRSSANSRRCIPDHPRNLRALLSMILASPRCTERPLIPWTASVAGSVAVHLFHEFSDGSETSSTIKLSLGGGCRTCESILIALFHSHFFPRAVLRSRSYPDVWRARSRANTRVYVPVKSLSRSATIKASPAYPFANAGH